MRPLYIRVTDDSEPLTPSEIATRLLAVFDHCISDIDEAQAVAKDRIEKYQKYFTDKGEDVQVVIQMLMEKWEGATILYAWDDDDESAKFRAVICNNDSFILEFYQKLSWPKRRSIAKRIAEALDYKFELGEEC